MMIKLSALNDLGDEIACVTMTDLPTEFEPEKHPLVRKAFELLAEEVREKVGPHGC